MKELVKDSSTIRPQDYSKYRPKYSEDLFAPFVETLKEDIGVEPSEILEVGCGTAHAGKWIQRLLPNSNLHLVDKNPKMLSFLKKKKLFGNLLEGMGENLPLPHHSTDGLIWANSFHNMDRGKSSLEARRVLRPHGAILLISTMWPRCEEDARVDNCLMEIKNYLIRESEERTDLELLSRPILNTGAFTCIHTYKVSEQVEMTAQDIAGFLKSTQPYINKVNTEKGFQTQAMLGDLMGIIEKDKKTIIFEHQAMIFKKLHS